MFESMFWKDEVMSRLAGTRRLGMAMAATLALAACAAPPQERDPARCAFLLDQYDRLERTFPNETVSSRTGRRVVNPVLGRQIALIRGGRCLTMTADLAGMEAFAETLEPFQPSTDGAAVAPTFVSAGVLTSMADEARTVAVFGGLGYRVSTIGAQDLGRRVYLGPFTGTADVERALADVQGAGFFSAYATRFGPL